jgi:hypothetical protein
MTVSTQNSQRDRGWVDGENAIKVNITGLSQLIDLNKIYIEFCRFLNKIQK